MNERSVLLCSALLWHVKYVKLRDEKRYVKSHVK